MSSIVGTARPLAPFQLGFDVLSPVTEAMLQEATARGMTWVGRYLNVLSPSEVTLLFDYGMGILPYTEAMTSAPLTDATGRSYGKACAAHAATLGIPEGVHVAIDLEAPAEGSDAAHHVNAMSEILRGQGRPSALYVGVPQPLSGPELFRLAPNRYIKGGGAAAEPPCGWSAIQLEPLEGLTLAGVKVDVEVSKFDYLGRALMLWWGAS